MGKTKIDAVLKCVHPVTECGGVCECYCSRCTEPLSQARYLRDLIRDKYAGVKRLPVEGIISQAVAAGFTHCDKSAVYKAKFEVKTQAPDAQPAATPEPTCMRPPLSRDLLQGKLSLSPNMVRELPPVGALLGGSKLDQGKLRWSLLPMVPVEQVLGVLEYGAAKYSVDNWQRVEGARTRYYDAALRHLMRWWAGETVDPESGLPHLAHAACCLLFLLWFEQARAEGAPTQLGAGEALGGWLKP
jgi:hypothetical protein